MKPIISINRSLDRNERWTNQLIGHLEQGSFSDGHFKGLVEIKQLGNKYRLFFSDVYFEPSLLSKKERESSDSDDSSDESKYCFIFFFLLFLLYYIYFLFNFILY